MAANREKPAAREAWVERDWENLLEDIKFRRVIPIIGSELLMTEAEGQPVALYRLLAERLAEGLGLKGRPLTKERTLNDVVCEYVKVDRARNAPSRLYARLNEVYAALAPPPPPALLKLAEITGFHFFVTTTPDPLLAAALNQQRFGGAAGSSSLTFRPRGPEDLPAPLPGLECPTVYHLLGQLANTQDQYVLSDEDMLEFFFSLQGSVDRLPNFFDALRESHLLFLGGAFSDWLSRFFLRAAKRLRLSQKQSYDVVANGKLKADAELVLFLQTFDNTTRITGRNPLEFVDELHRRWCERHPAPVVNRLAYVPPPPKMPKDAIFLSYASEDRPRVQRIKAALDAAGFVVWFDKDQLKAGDFWENEIEKNIRECVLFLPIISRHTEQLRHNVYFRAEWNYADRITQKSDHSSKFVIPVAVDPVPMEEAAVPKSFTAINFEPAPEGALSPDFCARLRELVDLRRQQPERRRAEVLL